MSGTPTTTPVCGVCAAPTGAGMMKLRQFYSTKYPKNVSREGIEATAKEASDEAYEGYRAWVRRNEEAGRVLTVVSIDYEKGFSCPRADWWALYHHTISVRYYGNDLD